MTRTEIITRIGDSSPGRLAPGVDLHVLATGTIGARGLTTSLAIFHPDALLPYHQHPFSEVIIVLSGAALAQVEGRQYRLRPYDTLHLPAGTAHAVRNASSNEQAVLHSSFASDTPSREAVSTEFSCVDLDAVPAGASEGLVRFEEAPIYELAPRAHFRDLFARRLGSQGICGGYGLFEPGASLPCHFHDYDESITIVTGQAICQVAGQEHALGDCGTACIPQGRPHRFINRAGSPMAMIWVYAGDEPQRTLVDASACGING